MSWLRQFNRRVPYPIRLLIVAGLGLGFWKVAAGAIAPAYAISVKLRGRAPHCTWSSLLKSPFDYQKWEQQEQSLRGLVRTKAEDRQAGLTLVATPWRDFWIQSEGGAAGVASLLGEHRSVNAGSLARAGDVVIDCGAHIGIFTHVALERGARKVVAVEPHPLNIECLRRNFSREIAQGRVVVYPKGVWSSVSTLQLSAPRGNTAMGSLVLDRHAGAIEVPLTTIDRLVAELGLERVDFIKFDIEGAEREALKGAMGTLGRFKPRLMLDAYHLPDDPEVLPRLITSADPAYRVECGACEPFDKDGSRWVPHVMHFSVARRAAAGP